MAKATASPETAKAIAGETPPKRGSGMRYALLGAVALALAGGGAFFLRETLGLVPAAGGEGKTEKPQPARPPQFVPLETFTVNLRDDGSPERYLQVGLTYEVANSAAAEALKAHIPVIRSNILLLLSAKGAKEIVTPEGKAKLSEELLAAARKPLPESADAERGIRAVHYSAFIVQ